MTKSLLKYSPAVCAAGNEYHIFVYTGDERCMMEVTVGDESFTDDTVGLMRTECMTHCVTVPMKLLDSERSYTVHLTPITMTYTYEYSAGNILSKTYPFRPLPADGIKVLWLSDAHGIHDEPLAAAKAAGRCDLLVMGGDAGEELKEESARDNLFGLISEITDGSIPVISIRGNHEGRGEWAEKLGEFMPAPGGVPYYTFRLGTLWGIVLDSSETRECLHYGHGGNALHAAFKRKETDFIRSVADSKEYLDSGIKYRMVFSHIPFARSFHDECDDPENTYDIWVGELNRIEPDVLVTGHEHKIDVFMPDDDGNIRKMTFPMAISSGYTDINGNSVSYCTTLYTLKNGNVGLTFFFDDGSSAEYGTL